MNDWEQMGAFKKIKKKEKRGILKTFFIFSKILFFLKTF
jgi:hypothetical protein